jgi:hypothetical protein
VIVGIAVRRTPLVWKLAGEAKEIVFRRKRLGGREMLGTILLRFQFVSVHKLLLGGASTGGGGTATE